MGEKWDYLNQMADLLFVEGSVITMEDPVLSGKLDLAVANGKILAIGEPGELKALIGTKSKILNVKGKTLIPGLIDSHNHMLMFGQNLDRVDLSIKQIRNLKELKNKLRAKAIQTPPGEWIQAWGYEENYLEEKRHPSLQDLDEACPHHPVCIVRSCCHVMAVNSLGVMRAGITEKTPDPDRARIGRDATGRLNGLLFEIGAMDLVNRVLPKPSPEECSRALAVASDVYIREGLTLVTEAGAGIYGNPYEAAGFQQAWQSKNIKLRVSLGLMEKTYRLFPQNHGLGFFTGFGDDFMKIGPAKFIADGGVVNRLGAVTLPYEGTNEYGGMCEDPEDLHRRMEQAHQAGFQISVHAVGDRTIEKVLDIYEKILYQHPRAHRHRIEHVTISRPDFWPRFRQLGVTAVMQPEFIYTAGDMWIVNLGRKRISFTKPMKSMLKMGVVVAGSSDRPVTEGNPWLGIWAAVNRRTIKGEQISPEECLTPAEALKLYTVNGAWANGMESKLGTLIPGKFADILVLEEDPLKVSPEKLREIQVQRTFINGEEVYCRPT